MHKKKFIYRNKFSIIELSTVILIILLLISLLIPAFVSLKMNARTAICKGQMRQIGVLMSLYASTYDGFLPNDNVWNWHQNGYYSDLGWRNNANNGLYGDWNGHLLPFIDTPIKNYARVAKVGNDGNVRWPSSTGSSIVVPKDPLLNGWVVVNDAYRNGGYGDLKVFICPEIFTSTYDLQASKVYNGRMFPRLKLTEYCGFDANDNTYMGGGIPTNYLANNIFFGKFYGWGARIEPNSMRIDAITDISKKAFLVEGGLCNPANNYSSSDVYYLPSSNDRDFVLGGFYNSFTKTDLGHHKLSFVHDNNKIFWTSYLDQWSRGIYYGEPWNGTGKLSGAEVANQFNIAFQGKACLLPTRDGGGYAIVSFIDPDKGAIFKSFFGGLGISKQASQFLLYDEPEFHYLTGSSNVLFGDGAVATKEQSWIYSNNDKIGLLSKE